MIPHILLNEIDIYQKINYNNINTLFFNNRLIITIENILWEDVI